MKKLLIGGGALAILALIFVLATSTKDVEAPAPEAPATKAPLITVISGEVSLTKDGTTRTLGAPEEVQPPFTLTAKAGGSAVASFPDGSELRLDENSEIAITSASYTPGDGGLTVSAKLSIGRVWSSIVALVTPESAWEVETSNVVATVRGTAFGMEAHPDKKTTIIGSEHTIELTLKDPDTGERDDTRKLGLAEDEVVVIGDEDARDKTRGFPSARKRTDDDRNNPWVQKNEVRKKLKESEATETDDTEGEDTDGETSGTPVQTVPATTPKVPTPQAVVAPKPVSVSITSPVPLPGIVEGTAVPLTAWVVYSDGTRKEASTAVSWSVLGNVGSMRGYIFDPLLGSSVSELGRGYGSVRAVWKDPATGVEVDGATEIFEVKPKIIQGIQEG